MFVAVFYMMCAVVIGYSAIHGDDTFVGIIADEKLALLAYKVFAGFAAFCLFISAVGNWVKFFRQCRLLRESNDPGDL